MSARRSPTCATPRGQGHAPSRTWPAPPGSGRAISKPSRPSASPSCRPRSSSRASSAPTASSCGEPPDEALAPLSRVLAGERAAAAGGRRAAARPGPRGREPVVVSLILLRGPRRRACILIILTVRRDRRSFGRRTETGRPPVDAGSRSRRRPPPVAARRHSAVAPRPPRPSPPPAPAPPAAPRRAAAAPAVPRRLRRRRLPRPRARPASAWSIRAVERDLDPRADRRRPRPSRSCCPPGPAREWIGRAPLPAHRRQRRGASSSTLNGQRLPPLGGRGSVIRELVLPAGAGGRLVSLFGSLADRVRQGLRRTRELMDEGLDTHPRHRPSGRRGAAGGARGDPGRGRSRRRHRGGAFVERVRDEAEAGPRRHQPGRARAAPAASSRRPSPGAGRAPRSSTASRA